MITQGKAANMEPAGIWIDSSKKLFHMNTLEPVPNAGHITKRGKSVKRRLSATLCIVGIAGAKYS